MNRSRYVLGVTTAILILAWSRPGFAQDVVAGWEGGDSAGYAFIAPTMSLAMTPKQSILVRATASYLYYNSEADGPIDVTAPGGAASLGYRFNGGRVNFALFGGFERRHVRGQWEEGASGSGELFFAVTHLMQISTLGTFAQAHRYAWARTGLKRQFTNTDFTGPRAFSAGVEATAQGNNDVTTYQLGGVVEYAWLRSGFSVQFRGGRSVSAYQVGPDQRRPYFGVGIYRRL